MPVPPKSRMPLRYRAQYSDRVSVYREFNLAGYLPWWRVGIPDAAADPLYVTFDEAVHEAHRLAAVKVDREVMAAATDPTYGGRWLTIHGTLYDLDASAAAGHPVEAVRALMQAAWA